MFQMNSRGDNMMLQITPKLTPVSNAVSLPESTAVCCPNLLLFVCPIAWRLLIRPISRRFRRTWSRWRRS